MNATELKKLQAEITQGKWEIGAHNANDNTFDIVVRYAEYTERIACVYPKPHYDDTQGANIEAITSVPKLLRENERLREAILATLERSGGKLHDTDQETGETFSNLLKAALGEKE